MVSIKKSCVYFMDESVRSSFLPFDEIQPDSVLARKQKCGLDRGQRQRLLGRQLDVVLGENRCQCSFALRKGEFHS